MQSRERCASGGKRRWLALVVLLTGLVASVPADAVDVPGVPMASTSVACAAAADPLAALARPVANATACEDCDSNQGYCTPGNNVCRNYCLQLVGLEGICHQSCGCCVCPEVPPGGGGGGDPGVPCQPVCRCDGVPGPQGQCPTGCRQVNCI